MKKFVFALLGTGMIASHSFAEDPKPAAPKQVLPVPAKPAPPVPVTPPPAAALDPKEVSYAVGMRFGSQLKSAEFEFNLEEISKGMNDVFGGSATKMTEQQAQQMMQRWQMAQQPKMEAKRKKEQEEAKKKADENKAKGDAFLAETAKKPSVKKIQDGLFYEVIKDGTGKSPTTEDTVKVHYTGTLIDGTEFDSSRTKGQPAEFGVTRVIKGWTEAVQKMKVGSRWKLYIAPELAYGEFGRPNIPGNSVLVFDVELLDIKSPEKPKAEDSVQAVSGEIIKVPSAEELKKGAKIEVLKEEDVKRMLATNAPKTNVTSTNAPPKK